MIVKVWLSKVVVTRLWIDQCKVGVQDTAPAGIGLVDAAIAEVCVPFFSNELFVASVGGRRVQRDHVNAFDVLDVVPEIGDVVDLVLKQYASDLVKEKLRRLVFVIRLE